MKYPYIMKDSSLTIFIGGSTHTVTDTHPNFKKIVKALNKGKSANKLLSLIDHTTALRTYLKGDIQIDGGVLRYKGEELHNVLTTKILKMLEDGFNIDPMTNFLINLKHNPSRTAQQELYDFLEAGDLPITEDGYFLAYKSVRSDYKDYHSGQFDNSVGATCSMDRGEVCDNRDITCSNGLHFAQKEYAESFGRGGHLMVLKIHPKDVVSIPRDYNNTKGRCCRYEVIGEVPYSLDVDTYNGKAVWGDYIND